MLPKRNAAVSKRWNKTDQGDQIPFVLVYLRKPITNADTDPQTLEHYEENAQRRFDQYVAAAGGIAEFFQASLPASATILDVGAGSGRNLDRLIDLGYDA